MRMTALRLWISIIAGLILGVAVSAEAQAPPFADLPGLNETQRITAGAVQTVCGKLTVQDAAARLRGNQRDLLERCREMVRNSTELQTGSPVPGSLGLDAPGLAGALNSVTPDEIAAQGTLAGETGSPQFRLLAGRLAALRRGGSGFSLDLDFGKRFTFEGAPSRVPDTGASADVGSGALGVFVNAGGAFGDKDSTSREVGFDFYSLGVLGGVDYRFTPNFIAGVALGYDFTDADFDNLLGDSETHTYSATLYGTYYVGRWYLDAHTGFAWNEYETRRHIRYATIDRTAFGDTDGQQYTVGLGTGYAIPVGPFTITPLARAEFLYLDIDKYSESGAQGLNLTIRQQDFESFQTTLGASVSYAISVPFGVLVPQVRVEWRHEFLNNERSVAAKYTADPFNTFFSIPTDRPDRDFFPVAVGMSAGFARGVSAFVNYETILGLRDITHHDFRGGVRVEF